MELWAERLEKHVGQKSIPPPLYSLYVKDVKRVQRPAGYFVFSWLSEPPLKLTKQRKKKEKQQHTHYSKSPETHSSDHKTTFIKKRNTKGQ